MVEFMFEFIIFIINYERVYNAGHPNHWHSILPSQKQDLFIKKNKCLYSKQCVKTN